MPLSTVFQLYRGRQIYWWRKPKYPQKIMSVRYAAAKVIQLRVLVMYVRRATQSNIEWVDINTRVSSHIVRWPLIFVKIAYKFSKEGFKLAVYSRWLLIQGACWDKVDYYCLSHLCIHCNSLQIFISLFSTGLELYIFSHLL
jgi:hypothetical protein